MEPIIETIWYTHNTYISKQLIVYRNFGSCQNQLFYEAVNLRNNFSPTFAFTGLDELEVIPYYNFLAIWSKEKL